MAEFGFDASSGPPPDVVGAAVAWILTHPDAAEPYVEADARNVEAQEVCVSQSLLPGWPSPDRPPAYKTGTDPIGAGLPRIVPQCLVGVAPGSGSRQPCIGRPGPKSSRSLSDGPRAAASASATWTTHLSRAGRTCPSSSCPDYRTSPTSTWRRSTTSYPRRVLVVEVRGRGRSEAPPSGYTVVDHMRDLRAVLEQERIRTGST
jgi:hypothetical protein